MYRVKIFTVLVFLFTFTAVCYGSSERASNEMKLMIDGVNVPVEWEDNNSVKALKENLPLTVKMNMYGGFEQVGSLGVSLPRNDRRITTSAGDIVLYSGNQIVVFYGSNTWEYTRLGKITGKSKSELTKLLAASNVTITIE